MFIENSQKYDLNFDEDIIEIGKSLCGSYLAILGKTKFKILDLNTPELIEVAKSERDAKSIEKYGFNHWVEWVSPLVVAIGTQPGSIFILSLMENRSISSIKVVQFGKVITAHSRAYKALVISTSGPSIHFISPNNGEMLYELLIPVDSSTMIRTISIQEPHCIFTFSDGKTVHSVLKQNDIIEKNPISLDFLSIDSSTSAALSPNHLFTAVLSFNGMLMLHGKMGAKFVADQIVQYAWSRNSAELFAVSITGEITIFSTRTMKGSTKKFNTEFNEQKSFISCSVSDSSNCFFLATQDSFYLFHLLVTDTIPSPLFHNSDSLIVFPSKVKVPAPIDLLKHGYPLMHAAIGVNGSSVVVAGRQTFAMHNATTKAWHFVNDRSNLCRSLWSQNGFFVTVVFSKESDMRYKLLLISPDSFSVLDSVVLDGVFNSLYSICGDEIAIATLKTVTIFRIIEHKLVKIITFNDVPSSFEGMVLLRDEKIAIMTDFDLIEYPSKELISDGVTYAFTHDGLLFFIAHGQQFVRLGKELIRLQSTGIYIQSTNVCSIPVEYEIPMITETNLLAPLMIQCLNRPDQLALILEHFITTHGTIEAVAEVIGEALKQDKMDSINIMFRNFEAVKSTFIVVALILLDPQYREQLKQLLPPYNDLIARYPALHEQLEEIYNQ